VPIDTLDGLDAIAEQPGHLVNALLKAYLIAKGLSEQVLRDRPFGHDIKKLVR
jgi:hypothetical protein